jgi:uncharacterized protein YkwD/LysM repeat protein
MTRRAWCSIGVTVLTFFAVFSSSTPVDATPTLAGSPYDLVNAVNALRASFGLSPYSISSILMSTAQAQADFLAATGTMTHSGPGGIGLTARLLAAGYPLAGDLSLGGFRAENITGGDESMPPEAAVDRWTSDAPHLNTMVSQNLTEIGAGVAISNRRVYYVIDAARPTSAGDPPAVATSVTGGSPIPNDVSPELIIPVSVSTPNADGNVFHDVKFGQTLWQIAITYGVKIDDIKRLNNLFNNNIYPGSSLLITQGAFVPTGSPTESLAQATPSTDIPTLTPAARSAMTVTTPGTATRSTTITNTSMTKTVIGIILLALIGGGLFTWLGRSRKK